MKAFIKGFVYSYIALTYTQNIVKTFAFLDSKSFWLIVIAFALLNIFKRSILDLVSLPSKGPFFYFWSYLLALILLNILVAIIPDFRLMATTFDGFNIFGIVVGSTYLSPFLAGLAASLAISLISDFFYWLSTKKVK